MNKHTWPITAISTEQAYASLYNKIMHSGHFFSLFTLGHSDQWRMGI